MLSAASSSQIKEGPRCLYALTIFDSFTRPWAVLATDARKGRCQAEGPEKGPSMLALDTTDLLYFIVEITELLAYLGFF